MKLGTLMVQLNSKNSPKKIPKNMSRAGVMTSPVRHSTKYFINLEFINIVYKIIEIISYTFSDF